MRCVIKAKREVSNEMGYIRIDHDHKVFFTKDFNRATFFKDEVEARKMFGKVKRNTVSRKHDAHEELSGLYVGKRYESVIISLVVLIEYELMKDSYKAFRV